MNEVNQKELKKYTTILKESTVPKVLDLITNQTNKKRLENWFDYLLPKHHLNYASQEAYLNEHHLTPKDVIKNSILHIFSEIDNQDMEFLISEFEPLISNIKVIVLLDENKAIYLEIIVLLEYFQKMKELSKRYKMPYSDAKGTGHRSSSLKKLVKYQINRLEERLSGFFQLHNQDEREITEFVIKILKVSQKKDYGNMIEYLSFIEIYIGLDTKFFSPSANEIRAIEDVLSFHNGIRSTRAQLVKSAMIVFNTTFHKSSIDNKTKADKVLQITRYFFDDEFREFDKPKTKASITFNHTHIQKEAVVKTILHKIPIYAYLNKNSNDFLSEFFDNAVNSMLGVDNIFEEDKPTIDEVSPLYLYRNFYQFKKELGLTKDDIRALAYSQQLHQTN